MPRCCSTRLRISSRAAGSSISARSSRRSTASTARATAARSSSTAPIRICATASCAISAPPTTVTPSPRPWRSMTPSRWKTSSPRWDYALRSSAARRNGTPTRTARRLAGAAADRAGTPRRLARRAVQAGRLPATRAAARARLHACRGRSRRSASCWPSMAPTSSTAAIPTRTTSSASTSTPRSARRTPTCDLRDPGDRARIARSGARMRCFRRRASGPARSPAAALEPRSCTRSIRA